MIKDLLTNQTSKEKSRIKSVEISKLNHISKFKDKDLEVEILSLKEIQVGELHGVEVMARAWKGKNQLGFGKDGNVEIERFRIFNPPILVPDGTFGEPIYDEMLKKYSPNPNYREDVIEAIRQSLSHTVQIVGKENTVVINGKIGNTTSTFYPDANAETSSWDGRVGHSEGASPVSFATIRAASGTNMDDSFTADRMVILNSGPSSGNYWDFYRGFVSFDTSALPDTDVISAATLSVVGTVKDETLTSQSVGWTVATTASNTAATLTDFENSTAAVTRLATDQTVAGFDVGGSTYSDFALNASGLANISKTATSKFCFKLSCDIDNSEPSWVSNSSVSVGFINADTAGTSTDPKLVVVHAAPASGPANLKSYNTNLKANIKSINTNLIANVKSLNTNV